MVLSPSELREKVLDNEKDLMNDLEKEIDKALIESMKDNRSIILGSGIFGELSSVGKKLLIAKYETAGWNIKYESDQRDGDFYRFSPKKTYTDMRTVSCNDRRY